MLEYATLGQMSDQIGRQIQDTSASKAIQIKEWLNTHYSQVARGHRWKELLRCSEEKFSTSAGQIYLYLTKEVEQLYLIFPQNGMPPLGGRTLEALIDQFNTIYRQSQLTVNFAEAGEVGYRADFSTAGETLTISHSGTGTIECVVRGLVGGAEGVSSGNETVEVVSVTAGAGTVTANTWSDLGAVSCQSLAAGDLVTVTGTTSATVYAQIASGERVARYKRVRLMPPTQSSNLVTIVFKKRIARLQQDNQAVEIPVGQVLIDQTVATMLSFKREYAGASLHAGRARADTEELKAADSADSPTVLQMKPGMNLRRGFRWGMGGSGDY